MKKLIISMLFILFQMNMNAQTNINLTGVWVLSDMSEPANVFSLELSQNGNTVTGSHCSVMFNGDFIDCEVSGKYAAVNGVSINGTVSSNSATVTFFSTYANDYGQAVIKKISENQISWKITVPPSDTYFIPDEAILTKE